MHCSTPGFGWNLNIKGSANEAANRLAKEGVGTPNMVIEIIMS